MQKAKPTKKKFQPRAREWWREGGALYGLSPLTSERPWKSTLSLHTASDVCLKARLYLLVGCSSKCNGQWCLLSISLLWILLFRAQIPTFWGARAPVHSNLWAFTCVGSLAWTRNAPLFESLLRAPNHPSRPSELATSSLQPCWIAFTAWILCSHCTMERTVFPWDA